MIFLFLGRLALQAQRHPPVTGATACRREGGRSRDSRPTARPGRRARRDLARDDRRRRSPPDDRVPSSRRQRTHAARRAARCTPTRKEHLTMMTRVSCSDRARRRAVSAQRRSRSCTSTSAASSSGSASCCRSRRARASSRLPPDRSHGARQPAHGRARRAAAGHHHARQRVGEGQRGRLLPRDRSAPGGRRGRELPLRHVAARADDAAQRARPGGARRSAGRARAAEPASCSRSSTTRPIRGASRCRPSR